jgi:flagellar biosynthetic protein FlhB
MLGQGKLVIAAALDGDQLGSPIHPGDVKDTIITVGAAAVRIGAPILLIAWLAGALSHFGQIGWLFAPKAVQPKISKLNPINGFKRIFGLSGLVKTIIDSLKIIIVATVWIWTVRQHLDRIVVMPYLSVMECLLTAGKLLLDLALRLLAVLLLLGIIDFAYQRFKHAKDLKMSKQQVKEEMKQTEGDPEVKRRRMRIQQQIAMQRLNSAVPKADVIVTNPEHISIAIQYEPEAMNAPRIVAKGADYLALRIRQIAMREGIPIVERKPLARALYKDVAVGQEIPPDFYAAVAEVLAYVYRLTGKMAG